MNLKNLRNVAIIALAALAIVVIPGGGDVAELILAVVSLLFLVAIASLGFRLYRQNQLTLWGMTPQHRGMLYGSGAVLFMAIAGISTFWSSGLGVIVWFTVVIGSIFTAYTAIREARHYSI